MTSRRTKAPARPSGYYMTTAELVDTARALCAGTDVGFRGVITGVRLILHPGSARDPAAERLRSAALSSRIPEHRRQLETLAERVRLGL